MACKNDYLNTILTTLKEEAFRIILTTDELYYPNQCHTCHCFDTEQRRLERCTHCQMISYCGKEHALEDLKIHNTTCKALSKLGGADMFQELKKYSDRKNATISSKIFNAKMRASIKQQLFFEFVAKLERQPFLFELQMIEHPRVCAVCLESNQLLLSNCQNCPQSSFCQNHIGDPSHLKLCPLFRLECIIRSDKTDHTIFVEEMKKVPFEDWKKTTPLLPISLQDFLDLFVAKDNDRLGRFKQPELWEVYLSDFISRSLTLLYAMEILQFPNKSHIVINVIGAKRSDVEGTKWEVMLYWLPDLYDLKIVFIGPEVEWKRPMTLTTISNGKKKKLSLFLRKEQFELYDAGNPEYLKPDIVVAYNPGFFAYKSWAPAISEIFRMNCPFVFTSYAETEAFKDIETIRDLHPFAKYLCSKPNPFASFCVERSIMEEGLLADNQYLTIFKTGWGSSKKKGTIRSFCESLMRRLRLI